MDNQIVIQPCNRTLFSNKKEWIIDTCYSTQLCWVNEVSWKMSTYCKLPFIWNFRIAKVIYRYREQKIQISHCLGKKDGVKRKGWEAGETFVEVHKGNLGCDIGHYLYKYMIYMHVFIALLENKGCSLSWTSCEVSQVLTCVLQICAVYFKNRS
jgi:hypothetical protein